MKPARLLVLPVLGLVLSPLLLDSSRAATAASPPVFRQYHAPAAPLDVRGNRTKGDASGEPSLGFDRRTGDVMYMAEKATFRVHGFDLGRNEKATWTDVTDPVIGAQTSDPILWTDPVTHRTYANQLELQGGSLQAYTDDQGRTWTHSTMGGSVGLAFDHQSIVTGKPALEGRRYPAPLIGPSYLYYCTNDLYAASCAVSLDGGLNFLAATPVYVNELAGGDCRAIFGHLKTDPRDGTVYLPPDGCGTGQRLFVSKDNTFSWTSYPLPGSTTGDSGHPSIGIGRQDGAVYYAYGSNDAGSDTGRVHAQVSFDKGRTWTRPAALGKDLGIRTSRFPVAVAGDRGRAAVAFLGAKAAGDPSAAPDPTNPRVKAYKGAWNLYVSYTFDGGRTWKTYDALPGDPIQRGPVCTRGTTCLAGRNLLDFNDMVLDDKGRVMLALADGALRRTDDYSRDLAKATIVRQASGPSLYARPVSRG
ncbi:MAG: hypothetical protein JWN55_2702 [Frankiales bacterium]|nr:hypothetical protein [Frankiales bacterium]